MRILVCGTPGTGKTTISEAIQKKYGLSFLCVSDFVKDNHLFESYDEHLDTYEYDITKISEKIILEVKKSNKIVVETHSPEIFEESFTNFFDLIFVLRCQIEELTRRLKNRGYISEKIEMNVEFESFNENELTCRDIFDNTKIHIIGSEDNLVSFEDLSNQVFTIIDKNH